MAGDTLKIGFVGCGRATAELHLPALQHLADIEVTALTDVDGERLDRTAERFGIAGRFDDYRALLAEASLDVVAVCVPAAHHVKVASAALAAGKHLLVEKPLALRLEDCDRLIAEARSAAVKATVGYNLRSHRLITEVGRLLRTGALGPIEALRSCWTGSIRTRGDVPAWRDRRELGGGALMEIAGHHFDLWRFLLGTEIEEVFARSRSDLSSDQTVVVSARTTDGVLIDAVFSERTGDENEVEIYGREARLRVSLYRFDGLELVTTAATPGGVMARIRGANKAVSDLRKGLSNLRGGGDFRMSYAAAWRCFADAIRHGSPVPCPLEEGRRALAITLAAIESADTGAPIALSHTPYTAARQAAHAS